MPIGSNTAGIHMINIAITAADGSGDMWQSPKEMIPLGMNGNPEAFVAALKAGLPLVNTLRVQFNEFSFAPDGSMHPQFERFLAAAAAQGYQITLAYGSGDTQNIGIGDAGHPRLTNAEAYDALEQNFQVVQGAWEQMLDWADAHPQVSDAVYGWDVMNEAAAYRHSVSSNGADANYSPADFVRLYATHSADLAQTIAARAEGRILVGGWGYNGDFLTLAGTTMPGGSALDYIRNAVGDRLVWSGHFYAGWMGTNVLTDTASLEARLDQLFGVLAGDDVLITETNVNGEVDDPSQPTDYTDLFAASLEWFAGNGIGFGWFPGAQTGASHLIYVETNGTITFRHQHSLAHALNAWSLGDDPVQHAGNQWVVTTLITARLRNEDYEIASGEAQYDPLTKLGTAFGYAGDDSLQGTLQSNDLLYGGRGNDVIRSIGGDDFLFGQDGEDWLFGGSGIDHLFGGAGQDRLNGGYGINVLAGGAGNDTYIVKSGREIVREYAGGGTDLVIASQGSLSLGQAQFAAVENLSYGGTADFRGVGNGLNNQITGGAGEDTLSGGDGQDSMIGQGGDDDLTGGAGADRFVFGPGGGHDRLLDFTSGTDKLVLRGLVGIDSVAEALTHATQIGGDVVFDFGADGLLLRGVSLVGLAGDILLA